MSPSRWGLPVVLLACASAGSLGACATQPPLVVMRGEPGDKATTVQGDAVRFTRPPIAEYTGLKPGYHTARTLEEWRSMWDGDPKVPSTLDFVKTMVYAAGAESPDVQAIKVLRVVDTANTLHVFTRETFRGEGCVKKSDEKAPLDFVVADRIDKSVQFHVEVERAPSCGAAPTAQVKCRVGAALEWSAKVSASPGDMVECEATTEAKGVFATIDKLWQLGEVPGGSTTKLTFAKENTRVSFPVDLFGRYAIAFEIIDDAGRRGRGEATCDVLPQSSDDMYLQLAWAGFDATDDPSTFPRVALRVYEELDNKPPPAPPKGGKPVAPAPRPRGKECSVASAAKPDWCEVKTQGILTHFRVKNPSKSRFHAYVAYTDDRVDGGPYVCVRAFLGGKRTTEVCDKQKRGPDETWDLGVLEGKTGAPELETPFSPSSGAPPEPPPEKPAPKPAPKPGPKPADGTKK